MQFQKGDGFRRRVFLAIEFRNQFAELLVDRVHGGAQAREFGAGAHGVSNAILLAPVMRFNSEHPAVRERLAAAYDRCCHEEKTCTTVEEKTAWMIARLEHIVKHLDIPTSLKEFGVPAEDLEGLVNAGMQVQRLLVNNMRPVTADDARKLYQEIM